RIVDGRATANERYNQDARLCWQRFAVNACLRQAHDQRRAKLDTLRQDELALNALLRQRRTAARLDEIGRNKQQSGGAVQDNGRGDVNAPPALSTSSATP
ncbi:MAG: hypothetical protein LBH31_01195, partial [Burkholderiaceae bacterium]|nr:hypothetical protein [Burkholderiaceae bacterium]